MKLLFPLAVVVILAAANRFDVHAENARTQAMGGVSIIGDLSHVLYFPGSINDFPDQLTGTSGAFTDSSGQRIEYSGPFIGKKSLGKTVSVGFLANTVDAMGSSVLRSGFYDAGRSFFLEYGGDTLPAIFPMLPHALVGLDFGAVKIGLEGYYEYSRHLRTVAGSDRVREAGIRNIGGVLSATAILKNAWICALAGMGAPTIFGRSGDSALTAFESTKSGSMTAGVEIGNEFSGFTPVVGIFMTKEEFGFRTGAVTSPSYSAVILDAYVGLSTYLMDSLLFAVEYDANLYFDDIADTNRLSRFEYHDAYGYHGLHAGVERPFAVSGVIDGFTLRSGVSYQFTTARDQRGDTIVNYPLAASDMRLSAGIGFRKNVFCLDLFVNLASWNGVLLGPQAMAATLTVGLSRKFLGQ